MIKYHKKREHLRKQQRIGKIMVALSIVSILLAFVSHGLIQDICAEIAPVALFLMVPMGVGLIFSKKEYYILDDNYHYDIDEDSES